MPALQVFGLGPAVAQFGIRLEQPALARPPWKIGTFTAPAMA